jgi:hypothetical protein
LFKHHPDILPAGIPPYKQCANFNFETCIKPEKQMWKRLLRHPPDELKQYLRHYKTPWILSDGNVLRWWPPKRGYTKCGANRW